MKKFSSILCRFWAFVVLIAIPCSLGYGATPIPSLFQKLHHVLQSEGQKSLSIEDIEAIAILTDVHQTGPERLEQEFGVRGFRRYYHETYRRLEFPEILQKIAGSVLPDLNQDYQFTQTIDRFVLESPKDQQKYTIFITKGTGSAGNAFQNLNPVPTEFNNLGKTTKGFTIQFADYIRAWDQYSQRSFWDDVVEAKRDGHKLLFIGHSLGAAMQQLFLLQQDFLEAGAKDHVMVNVGAPAIASGLNSAKSFNEKLSKNTIGIFHEEDKVPAIFHNAGRVSLLLTPFSMAHIGLLTQLSLGVDSKLIAEIGHTLYESSHSLFPSLWTVDIRKVYSEENGRVHAPSFLLEMIAAHRQKNPDTSEPVVIQY